MEPKSFSAKAGGFLSVTDTVINQGKAYAKLFAVSYRLSGDTLYGGKDINLTPQRIVSTPVGPQLYNTSYGINLKLPLTTPAGTYYVCGKLFTITGEGDRNNNTRCSTSTVTVSLPDLVISALSTTATSVKAGGVAHVSFSVMNQGGSKSKIRPKLAFVASTDTAFGNGDDFPSPYVATSATLAPGQTITFDDFRVKMPTLAGTYHVCAKVDVLMAIDEINENNNTLCTPTTITVQP